MERVCVECEVGKLVYIDGKYYKVIGKQNGVFSLIRINSGDKTEFLSIDCLKIISKISIGEYEVYDDIKDNLYFSKEGMPKELLNVFKLKKYIVSEMEKEFAPLYLSLKSKKGTEFVNRMIEETGLNRRLVWKTMRLYLQSGFDENSLIDQRMNRKEHKVYAYKKRPGRKSKSKNHSEVILDDYERGLFEKYSKLWLKGKFKSKRDSYRQMLNENYKEIVETENGIKDGYKPYKDIPSFDQYNRYIKLHTDKRTIEEAKTSLMEFDNNKRLLDSDNLNGVTGPCSLCEVDECEIDLEIVDEDGNPIGRPIVYLIVDVYARLILGYSCGFENNSVRGISDCFLSLLVDKVELCKQHGIEIDKSVWPDHVLPLRIRSDNGSEYISYELERMMNEVGVQLEHAPKGTGSKKGQVEQTFHQIHTMQMSTMEKRGLITTRYDSDHIERACLTLKQYEHILIEEIHTYNTRFMKEYKTGDEMDKRGVKKFPNEIWKYGIEKYGAPRPFPNEDKFRFAFATPIKGSLSRQGICWKNLWYYNPEDTVLREKRLELGTKREEIELRMDSRSVSKVFYLSGNKICTASLNPEKTGNLSYGHYTMKEYEELYKRRLELDRECEQESELKRTELLGKIELTASQGITDKKLNGKGIRENRRLAKQKHDREIAGVPELIKLPEKHVAKKEKTKIPSLKEAMKDVNSKQY